MSRYADYAFALFGTETSDVIFSAFSILIEIPTPAMLPAALAVAYGRYEAPAQLASFTWRNVRNHTPFEKMDAKM